MSGTWQGAVGTGLERWSHSCILSPDGLERQDGPEIHVVQIGKETWRRKRAEGVRSTVHSPPLIPIPSASPITPLPCCQSISRPTPSPIPTSIPMPTPPHAHLPSPVSHLNPILSGPVHNPSPSQTLSHSVPVCLPDNPCPNPTPPEPRPVIRKRKTPIHAR